MAACIFSGVDAQMGVLAVAMISSYPAVSRQATATRRGDSPTVGTEDYGER
jgi:hypothetical protein